MKLSFLTLVLFLHLPALADAKTAPTKTQETKASEDFHKKVFVFESTLEALEPRASYPAGQEDKIDAFLATLTSEKEVIKSLDMFDHRYVPITTTLHAEKVVRRLLSQNPSLELRVRISDVLAYHRILTLELELISLLSEGKISKHQRLQVIENMFFGEVDSIVALRPYLDSDDVDYRDQALDTFSSLAPKATLSRNIKLLDDKDFNVRYNAVIRLGCNDILVTAPHFERMLEDKHSFVRSFTIRSIDSALTKTVQKPSKIAIMITPLLTDADSSIRSDALSLLVNHYTEQAIPHVLIALQDSEDRVLENAIDLSYNSAFHSSKLLPLLKKLLKSPHENIREAAAKRIEHIQ